MHTATELINVDFKLKSLEIGNIKVELLLQVLDQLDNGRWSFAPTYPILVCTYINMYIRSRKWETIIANIQGVS